MNYVVYIRHVERQNSSVTLYISMLATNIESIISRIEITQHEWTEDQEGNRRANYYGEDISISKFPNIEEWLLGSGHLRNQKCCRFSTGFDTDHIYNMIIDTKNILSVPFCVSANVKKDLSKLKPKIQLIEPAQKFNPTGMFGNAPIFPDTTFQAINFNHTASPSTIKKVILAAREQLEEQFTMEILIRA